MGGNKKSSASRVEANALAAVASKITADLSESQRLALLEIHKFILTLKTINGRRQVSRFAIRNAETLHRSRGNGSIASTIINSRTGVISRQSGLVTKDHTARDAQEGVVASDFTAEELGFTSEEFVWLCIPGTWNPWLDSKEGRIPKTPKARTVSQILRFDHDGSTDQKQRKRQISEDAYPTPTASSRSRRAKRARYADSDDDTDEEKDLDKPESDDEITPSPQDSSSDDEDSLTSRTTSPVPDAAHATLEISVADSDDEDTRSLCSSSLSLSSPDSPESDNDQSLNWSPHPSLFPSATPVQNFSSIVTIVASPAPATVRPVSNHINPVDLRISQEAHPMETDNTFTDDAMDLSFPNFTSRPTSSYLFGRFPTPTPHPQLSTTLEIQPAPNLLDNTPNYAGGIDRSDPFDGPMKLAPITNGILTTSSRNMTAQELGFGLNSDYKFSFDFAPTASGAPYVNQLQPRPSATAACNVDFGASFNDSITAETTTGLLSQLMPRIIRDVHPAKAGLTSDHMSDLTSTSSNMSTSDYMGIPVCNEYWYAPHPSINSPSGQFQAKHAPHPPLSLRTPIAGLIELTDDGMPAANVTDTELAALDTELARWFDFDSCTQ